LILRFLGPKEKKGGSKERGREKEKEDTGRES